MTGLSLSNGFDGVRRSGGATPFDPTTPGDLVLWLDATDASTITESSGSVSEWRDASAQSNDATQAVGFQQPTYAGAPGPVVFPGTAQSMEVADDVSLKMTGSMSIALRMKYSSANAANGAALSKGNRTSDQGYSVRFNTDGTVLLGIADSASSRHQTTTSIVAKDVEAVFVFVFDASAGTTAIYRDNVVIGSSATAPTSQYVSPRSLGINGVSPDSQVGLIMDLRHALIYARALTSGQVADLTTYLGA